jgi:hypothetical protein
MKTFTFAFLALATSAFAQLRGPAPQVLVPAAGSVAGSNGTFFHSDIAIYNLRDQAQNVILQWLPRGTSGASLAPVQIRLNPLSGIISEDFVADIVHQQGLGAMLVTAATDAGQLDIGGRLIVTSRVWTPQPGTTGTVSQTLPTVATSEINTNAPAILGQRISDQYRANVGIVNLSQTDQMFDVLQNSDDPTFAPVVQTVTVPAFAMQQISLLNARASALQVRVTPRTAISASQWVTYGSSVDNVTGDAWSSLGMILTP